ncbi:WAT1-RELATED PROTEIN [Salix koriyanagi]|uniref:WAT1-related protein n=1 Tax=Salix koriyanagi TaxID=2511006 RepID=A0A9Q0WQM8_9ROSI|nr:WAT1-RELATED PROTEIN [Salix koriyanagi]
MGGGCRLGEAAPFTVMVMMEGCTIALTIMAKTAMSRGMSPFVFVVYTNALGTLLLLPYSFFLHRERAEQPLFTLPLFLRFFFLGFTGIALSQNLAFVGLSYSSPIVVCVMGLLTPAFSFILSLVLRKSKVEWRRSSFQFKVIGTLITVMGAISVVIYKGPYIRPSPSSQELQHSKHQLFVFYSAPDNWILGCILLAASFFCVSLWNIIQLDTIKHYPQVMKIASFYSLAGTIQCAIFSLIVERNLNAWRLKLNMELLLIVITAIFGSVVRSSVQISFTRMKGPFYAPLFQPFRVFWATFFGVSFFVNGLHYGSVIGAVISGAGYYTVTWGRMREDEEQEESVKSSDEKIPLLQEDSEV